MSPDDDTVLLLRGWQRGDRAALLTLLERDRAWLERRLRRRRGAEVRRLEDTGDGVQDLILRALDYVPRFVVGDRAQFRALLGRMLEHQLVDRARQLQRQPRPRTLSEADVSRARLDLLPGDRVTPPDAAAARAEELGWMRLGLEFLPPGDREVVHARAFEELDFAAVGDRLDLGADAARMRFQRALLRLAGVVQRLQRGELPQLLREHGELDDPAPE
ncbi:MAG: RNA polymerase sigma factor [Planctomycetota bacterium]